MRTKDLNKMSILKWNKDFALEQAADDAELLEELLIIFKDSFQADVGLIKEGLEENSVEKISGAAHSIKGAAASLGIGGVQELAQLIEKDSNSGSLEVAKDKLTSLYEMLEEIKKL